MQRDGGPAGGGPAGGGNPTGGSFTGAAQALEIIGTHVYAYSGLVTATASYQEVLSFRSPTGYVVGILQLNSGIDASSPGNRVTNAANIIFNGITIARIAAGTQTDDAPTSQAQDLLIPPLTTVSVQVDSSADADRQFSITFIGRIYRG